MKWWHIKHQTRATFGSSYASALTIFSFEQFLLHAGLDMSQGAAREWFFLHGIVVAPKVLAVRYESVQRLCIYSDIVSLSSRILHCFGSGCSGINVQPSVQGWGHRMVYDANVEEGANRRDELEYGGLALAICGCFKVPEFHLWSSLAAASLIVYKHLQTKTVRIGNYSWKQTSTNIYKHLLWLSTILKIF